MSGSFWEYMKVWGTYSVRSRRKVTMRNDKPLISVIVPVFNGQEYLEKCIECIEDQTYGNLEIIIVNDGSTDDTAAVCERIQSVYDNVHVIVLGDEGVSTARNTGMDMAQGELISFVDADDRLRPDMFMVLYDCMTKTQSRVAGCGFFAWESEAEWEQNLAGEAFAACGMAASEGLAKSCRTYDREEYLKEAILKGNSRCWSKLYCREVLEHVRFPEKLTIGEDMLFLVRMLPHAERFAEVDYAGYGYFQNPVGAIKRGFTPRYMDQITCWKLAREEIVRMDQSLDGQVSALLMMGIMLTAGKLALLTAKERRTYGAYTSICHKELKEAMRVAGAYGELSAGYKLKAMFFLMCPGLYLRMYHLHKG